MHVVIIGNGIAGNSAARAIRDRSKETAITITSMEPFPLYSPCVLPHYVAGEIERDRVFLRTTQSYSQENIDVILGDKVTQLDIKNSKVLLETKSIPFDKLIIATGGEAVVPPIEGIKQEGVFNLKSLADADGIANSSGKTAVIIGSGFIGLEAAIALRKRNWGVSVIELLDWISPRVLDEKPALLIKSILEDHGVKVFTKEKVARISGNNTGKTVATDKGEIDCDIVIGAAGMKPNVELARQAGLKIGELGGIWTDEQMMTNIENIYACGDCVQTKDIITDKPTLSLLWHNAREQGIVAGLNSIGIKRSYPGSMDITGVDVFGTFTLSVGKAMSTLNGDNVEIIERQYKKNYRRLLITDRRIIGMQSIGTSKNVGMLLSLIRRRDDISKLRESLPGTKSEIFPPSAIAHHYLR